MTKNTDLAWAAGFFDGEGCFHCSRPYKRTRGRGTRVTLKATVGQVHPETLEKFHGIVGVGTMRLSQRPTGSIWVWTVQSFSGVEHVLEILRPYLGSVKIAQGEEALRCYREHRESR